MRSALPAFLLSSCLLLMACSGSSGSGNDRNPAGQPDGPGQSDDTPGQDKGKDKDKTPPGQDKDRPKPPPQRTPPADSELDLSNADRCDYLMAEHCLFPFPSNHFTRPDTGTDTGLRIAFSPWSMPRNTLGRTIDPTDWNRSDGFSPGQMIVTQIPGIDLERSGAVPLDDLDRAFDRDAPIVVIEWDSLERHLVWAELDSNAESADEQTLMIRPARNFEYGKRYIVALRNLVDGDGEPIEAGTAFRFFRDGGESKNPTLKGRQESMEEIFERLEHAGIPRHELFLAWDFTVASSRSLTERILHMRDQSFAELAGAAPSFKVTRVEEYSEEEDENVARRVQGYYTVPSYLALPERQPLPLPLLRLLDGVVGHIRVPLDQTLELLGLDPLQEPVKLTHDLLGILAEQSIPLNRFIYPSRDATLPMRPLGKAATLRSYFDCIIPHSAADQPARPALYGHGLFGTRHEVGAGNVKRMAQEHNMAFCATDWVGMSTGDVPNAVLGLIDMSNFGALADQSQQGFLNFMFLGELMLRPDGLLSHAAFQVGTRSTWDRAELFYDGNSQGAIFGGALAAVYPQINRAVLGVPGMNYSLLLRRSTGFDTYSIPFDLGYRGAKTQTLVLSLVQMLWDRGETNGYAGHLGRDNPPLPGKTSPTDVLLHVALGDHLVTDWSAEVMARTMGAHRHCPTALQGRTLAKRPYYAIPCIPGKQWQGSAMVVWDSGPTRDDGAAGNDPSPVENQPNRAGRDPHSDPRNEVGGRLQKSTFLETGGGYIDVCDGQECFARGYRP